MKNLFIIFVLITAIFSYGQSYDRLSKGSELCLLAQGNSFLKDKDAEVALDKILSVIGASKRFILQPCSNIDNAVATSYKGLRYILYDREFMGAIANKTNNWSQLFILAHEVGHHINGHSIDLFLTAADIIEPKTLEVRRLQELESDEFAGFILAKLGATLEETSEAIILLTYNTDDTYSTHPNKTKRLNAIKVGYNKALGNLPVTSKKLTTLQTALDYFYYACDKVIMEDYYGAIADYTTAIEINPNFSQFYYCRGIVKQLLEDHDGGIEDYTIAIQISPNEALYYENRGSSKEKLKDYYGAIADYTTAIEIIPNYAEAYSGRGLAKMGLKDRKGAIQDYAKAIEINPNHTEAYQRRSIAKLAIKDYYGAIADLTKAIQNSPNNAKAYMLRGMAKLALKNYYMAKADFTKVIELSPTNAKAYYFRGVAQYKTLNMRGACQDVRKAQQLGYDASTEIQAFCN